MKLISTFLDKISNISFFDIQLQKLIIRFVIGGFTAFCLQACQPEKQPVRPNILFLLADDQRRGTISALGNDEIITPNLDQLVESGTSFSNAYIMGAMNGAVCAPSRAMLMTGRALFNIDPTGNSIDTMPISLCQKHLLRQDMRRSILVNGTMVDLLLVIVLTMGQGYSLEACTANTMYRRMSFKTDGIMIIPKQIKMSYHLSSFFRALCRCCDSFS